MAETLIPWDVRYGLGFPEIGDQHRSLFELIERIWAAIIDRSTATVVVTLVEEPERYTLAHFAAEETFMRATGFTGFDAHKREHELFVKRISVEKKRAVELGTLSLDLIYFLRDWLVEHILVSDRAYADFTNPSKTREVFARAFVQAILLRWCFSVVELHWRLSVHQQQPEQRDK